MNTRESAGTRIVDPARLPFAYQDALNAGDAGAVVALFRQDATMHTFTGKVLTGQEALHAEAVQSIAAQARLASKPRSTLIGGDTALIIVDWDLEAMLPDGTGISPAGTTTAVARRVVAVRHPRLSRGSWISRVVVVASGGAIPRPAVASVSRLLSPWVTSGRRGCGTWPPVNRSVRNWCSPTR
jgi:uncharacterized protein (TIGR02246 family)